jgi:uncharacterized protein YjbJ (UPF0337 family)
MGAVGNKIKGTLKKVEGRVTGDRLREAQGKVQETAGNVGLKVKATAAKVKAKARAAKKRVSTKPGRKAAAAKVTP